MTTLLDLAAELRSTHAAVRRMEEMVSARPDDDALEINMLSLRKRQLSLERQFAELADQKHTDVLGYRFIPESGASYPLSAVAGALASLQEAVAVVFDALRTSPKIKARISAEVAALTTFDFAYTYEGSLGFAFSIPNDRLMFVDSDLDRAISLVFRAMKANSREEVRAIAGQIGAAGVSRIYRWADYHARFDIGADLEWRRRLDVRTGVRVQPPELARLKEIIEETTDVAVNTVTVTGVLLGIDVKTGTFRLAVPEGEDMHGTLSEEFDRTNQWAIQTRYQAVVTARTKISYATERETTTYELLSLREPGQNQLSS